jgi:hypothetical protein
VLATVKLDYKATRQATEIDYKFTDRKLATKLETAKLTCANAVPEFLFGRSRVAAEHARHPMNSLAGKCVDLLHSQPHLTSPGQGEDRIPLRSSDEKRPCSSAHPCGIRFIKH